MRRNWLNSTFRLFAVIAMVVALALLLIPHAHAEHLRPCLALFTALLIEVLPFVRLIPGTADQDGHLLPDAPVTPASFQRPPPSLFA